MAELGTAILLLISACFSYAKSERQSIAGMLFFLALSHLILADYLFNFEGWIYYPSAAITQYIAIRILLRVHTTTVLIRDLTIILFAGILINFAGWLMYWLEMKPIAYNGASIIFYLAVVVRLFIRNKLDGRCAGVGKAYIWIFGSRLSSANGILRDKKANT